MDVLDVLQQVKTTFSKRKKIDFDEYNISFELAPTTSLEELKVLEACKDTDGAEYIEAVKKHTLAFSVKKINDVEFGNEDVEYDDDNGKSVTVSKYVFMLRQVEEWPASLRDLLFEAFVQMQDELERDVRKKAKFDRIQVMSYNEEGEDEGQKLRKVEEAIMDTSKIERDVNLVRKRMSAGSVE